MNVELRRQEILSRLSSQQKPISASTLAEQFQVSRQVIVGDVALLRAQGAQIIATQSGYVMDKKQDDTSSDADTYILACRHDKVLLEKELYSIIDNGGVLVNVMVEHAIYGTITQPLSIASRYDADTFLKKIAITSASLLSAISGGAHLHTIRCANPDAYKRILASLKKAGILYTESV